LRSKTACGFEGPLLIGGELSNALNGIALSVDVRLEGFGGKTTSAGKQFLARVNNRLRGRRGRNAGGLRRAYAKKTAKRTLRGGGGTSQNGTEEATHFIVLSRILPT